MTFFFFALHLILSPYFDVVDTRIRTGLSNAVNTRYSASPSNFPRGTSPLTLPLQYVDLQKKFKLVPGPSGAFSCSSTCFKLILPEKTTLKKMLKLVSLP